MAEMEIQPRQQGVNKHFKGKGYTCHKQNQNKRFMNYKKKNLDAISILKKFGPSNNFMKFKKAESAQCVWSLRKVDQ